MNALIAIRFPTPETKIKKSIIGYNNGVLNEMQIRNTHSPVKRRIKHCINSTKEKYHRRQKIQNEVSRSILPSNSGNTKERRSDFRLICRPARLWMSRLHWLTGPSWHGWIHPHAHSRLLRSSRHKLLLTSWRMLRWI